MEIRYQHLTLVQFPVGIRTNVFNLALVFQDLARFMAMLNLFLPAVSFLFILNITKDRPLNICLGKGYLNFLSTKAQLCSWENPYICGMCWVWLIILYIGNSKFQINILVRINVGVG